ncbi:hypothetical protein G9P44_002191 [Scheffersomyces stipitis]|nr:hypothetical protein G9P44_002191 [Scheffersomyces stipitis]
MSQLPIRWQQHQLSDKEFIYGFHSDPEDRSIGFYVTDFATVWIQRLEGSSFLQVASSYGFEDLSPSRIRVLFELMEQSIYDTDTVKFRFEPGDSICSVSIGSKDINWDFSLVAQDQRDSVRFLSSLNYQQFANHKYLLYAIEDLKKTIEVKDTYIRFLTENFKQSHGTELLSKYKKNNRNDTKYITKFNDEKWQQCIDLAYKKNRNSSPPDRRSKQDIEASIRDIRSWKSTEPLSKKSEAEVQTNISHSIKDPHINAPKGIKKIGAMKITKKLTAPTVTKLEPKEDEQISTQESTQETTISPTKRAKKFGMMSSKRRKT